MAGGIAGLYFGSAFVLARLPKIARALGVSELVVTILGVSILTSLPELAVSGYASYTEGQAGAESSIGNILGSNFVTLTFVLSLCALVKPFNVKTTIKDRETTWMILSSATLLVLATDGTLSRLDGGVLILVYFGYLVSVIKQAAKERAATEKREKLAPMDIIAVIFGIGLIMLGANLTVDGGTVLGRAIGFSPLAIGVIIFAAGTSLPELAISLGASLKGKSDVILGEVYASNIFTAFVVLGICLLIQPLDLGPVPNVLRVDLPLLILGATAMQLFVTTDRMLERWEAVVMLVFYGYYVYLHVG